MACEQFDLVADRRGIPAHERDRIKYPTRSMTVAVPSQLLPTNITSRSESGLAAAAPGAPGGGPDASGPAPRKRMGDAPGAGGAAAPAGTTNGAAARQRMGGTLAGGAAQEAVKAAVHDAERP